MIIDGREIGPGHPPYIIAEISGNHGGNFNKAIRLIEAAKNSGADAVKFQYYTPDSITLDCDKPDFIIKDGPWKGRKLYELYQKAHTPPDWFEKLFACARELHITPFSSVFDPASVDALEALDCPAYKIASMEITDLPLIQYAAKTGKPMIISTGMAHHWDIEMALDVNNDAALLHCVSGYPTKIEDSNLEVLRDWGDNENITHHGWCGLYGISDHSVGTEIPIAATAMGACIIEKHLMLADGERTEDYDFSMTPIQFLMMVRAVKKIWQATQPPAQDVEASSRQLRRSLYVTQDMKKGDVFTHDNVRSIRPGYGMQPQWLPKVIGKKAYVDIERGTALQPALIEG